MVTALPLATRPLTAGQRLSDVWAYLLVAAMCVPFAFHRRYPVAAIAVASCALVLYAVGRYTAYPGLPVFALVAGISLHSTRRRAALAAGQTVFGENRVQEAATKFPRLRAEHRFQLHIIGGLQTNKARDAVRLADVIETLDRPRVVDAVAAAMAKVGRTPKLLIEVNTGDEAQKSGVARADAGDIVDQLSVPILQDDDAREVFVKVTVAAETILARSLPQLIAGTAARTPQPIVPGEYFGRREPRDGRIDWTRPALEIHNLVRAVAPPFPAAFAQVAGERWEIHRTRVSARRAAPAQGVRLFAADGECYVACADGGVLWLRSAADARGPIDLAALARQLTTPVPLC